MTKPLKKFAVVTLALCLISGICGLIPEEGMQDLRTEVLDDDYHVSWQADFGTKTIDFWIVANTVGYVGFGLSTSGQMNGADLVAGGVNNSATYFRDYHGGDPVRLTEDEQQDWKALEVSEEGGRTSMHLRRKFDTCDSDDIAITEGTVKLMWSLGSSDDVTYHGNRRGARAVNLLDPPPETVDLSAFQTFNITSSINMTPATPTLYWCSIHKREANTSSQVVAFKPKFDTPEALKFTHHFNAYRCVADEGEDPDVVFGQYVDGPGRNCYELGGLNTERIKCQAMLYAWSLGGRILVLPKDVGFTWGESQIEYFFLEVHLDNVEKQDHLVETGITFYYTEEPRPIEAGILTVAHLTAATLLIPPATENWEIVGHCGSECINSGLPEAGIHIFNVNLHAHVSGRKMKFRLFRSGTELPWIARDETYDFDFQENRPLPTVITVYPGDQLALECTYASTWKSVPGAVIGGASSYDEMCMVFALYYPRTPLERCSSWTPLDFILNKYGIEEYSSIPGSVDMLIEKPEKWANRTFSWMLDNNVSWTPQHKAELQQELKYGSHESICTLVSPKKGIKLPSGGYREQKTGPAVSYPDIDKEYQEPTALCGSSRKIFQGMHAAVAAILMLQLHNLF